MGVMTNTGRKDLRKDVNKNYKWKQICTNMKEITRAWILNSFESEAFLFVSYCQEDFN